MVRIMQSFITSVLDIQETIFSWAFLGSSFHSKLACLLSWQPKIERNCNLAILCVLGESKVAWADVIRCIRRLGKPHRRGMRKYPTWSSQFASYTRYRTVSHCCSFPAETTTRLVISSTQLCQLPAVFFFPNVAWALLSTSHIISYISRLHPKIDSNPSVLRCIFKIYR